MLRTNARARLSRYSGYLSLSLSNILAENTFSAKTRPFTERTHPGKSTSPCYQSRYRRRSTDCASDRFRKRLSSRFRPRRKFRARGKSRTCIFRSIVPFLLICDSRRRGVNLAELISASQYAGSAEVSRLFDASDTLRLSLFQQ